MSRHGRHRPFVNELYHANVLESRPRGLANTRIRVLLVNDDVSEINISYWMSSHGHPIKLRQSFYKRQLITSVIS